MNILFDECVPWPMHQLLTNHACTSVEMQGWRGIRNGILLERAQAGFDLFITSDQNIRYQQNLAGRSIAILELSTNDLRRIRAAKALIEDAVAKIQPNEFRQLTYSITWPVKRKICTSNNSTWAVWRMLLTL